MLGFIRGGLQRLLDQPHVAHWGVPLPWDPEHVAYVWFDALDQLLHRRRVRHRPERFADWWPAVHHLIGKDIIRFHCVYWPAMLMAAGVEPPPHVRRRTGSCSSAARR